MSNKLKLVHKNDKPTVGEKPLRQFMPPNFYQLEVELRKFRHDLPDDVWFDESLGSLIYTPKED